MTDALNHAISLVAALSMTGCAATDGDMKQREDTTRPNAVASSRPLATVTGRIVYAGPPPAQTKRYVPNLNRSVDEHTIHIDQATGGLRDVVVHLRSETDAATATPAADTEPTDPPTMNQIEEVFVPHVLAVRAGQPVRFTSADPGNHNIRAVSFIDANTFSRYFREGAEYYHTFKLTENHEPVMLICDIHDWMKAWVYVFDHERFVVSERDGSFAIRDVPAGRYTLVAHHADGRLKLEQPITVADGGEHQLTLTLTP